MSWVSGAFGVLGILVGAFLQYRFGIQRSKKDTVIEMKASVYEDFVRSIVGASFAEVRGEVDGDVLSKVAEAKARACIYGEPSVIEAIAEAWRKTDGDFNFDKQEHVGAIVKIIREMRDDGFAGGKVDSDNVSRAVFAKDLSRMEDE